MLQRATIAFCLFMLFIVPAPARDGETVYIAECATCHNSNTPRTPTFDVLKGLETGRIVSALESGAMRIIGTFSLTAPERIAVAEYITGDAYNANWKSQEGSQCAAADQWPATDPFADPHWNGWGGNLANTRSQTAANAQLDVEQIPELELKWAFAFPGETFVESQPSVVGGRIFVGSPSGTVYALDAKSGCIHWTFQAEAPVKAPVSIGALDDGSFGVFFGDQAGRVYSLNAVNGAERWRDIGDDHPSARVTGGVQLFEGKVYVPMASLEEGLAMDPGYECCVFRGSVIAYRADTGQRIWKQYTIKKLPAKIGRTTTGDLQFGPSGAAVWSAVTIDTKLRRIYLGTGDNYSNPPSGTSDSVLAFDLDSGELAWNYEGLGGDAWNIGCMSTPKVNCPENEGPDEDMGASPILVSLPSGKRLLIGAQKTGVAHALDPDNNGELVWRKQLAEGGVQGGLQWGQSTDSGVLYASRSDLGWLSEEVMVAKPVIDPNQGGGTLAVDLETGEILWEADPVSCAGREVCSPAAGAAITTIPGALFTGSLSGEMRALDTSTGEEIWRYDTVREYDTVNGANGRGGAIEQAGAVIVGGMVYFNSGYSKWGALPGNVLLAFGLPDKQ
ncbi:MAG: PQQ-binding-like beta-propeller repeat protein [Pseudomonadota bacterium]